MPWTLVAVAVVFAVASTAQAASGFGFALIAIPLVAVLTDPKVAVVGMTLLGPVISGQLAVRGRRDIRVGAAAAIAVTSVIGMPLGLVVLSRTSDDALTVLIAVAVLVFTALLWRGLRLPESRGADVAAGLASGILATSTGTNGPPLVIALAGRGLDRAAFRSTINAIFVAQSLLALAAFAIVGRVGGDALEVAAAGLPGVLLGSFVGESVFGRLPESRFRSIVLAMLAMSAIVALVGVLVGSV